MSVKVSASSSCLVGERSGLLHRHLGQDGVDALGVGELGVVPLLARPVHGGRREDQQALHQQQEECLKYNTCEKKLILVWGEKFVAQAAYFVVYSSVLT